MIRQARRYLVGAVSSVTVVSGAIVVFVVLVSTQVFTDWPIPALGGNGDRSAVADASAVSGRSGATAGAAKTVDPEAATTAAAAPAGGGNSAGGARDRVAAPQDNASVGSSAPPVTRSESVTSVPERGPGGTESSPADETGSSSPAAPAPSSPAPSSGGGGNATSTSSGGSSGGSGGGSGGGSKPGPGNVVEEVVAPVTGGGGSTSAKVTETVNETVNSVDETVTGGALEETGVTGITEEVVNGVAGPESAVGKTVDELGNAVGGLLGGNR